MTKNCIAVILRQKEMTPYQLAQITGISQNRVYAIVNAAEIPPRTTWDTIKKIAKALDVKIDDLENGDNHAPSTS